MNADEKAVADVQVSLWDAINRYATTCGGDPSQHVYGNTPRMTAVADTNRVIHNLAARIRADAERETAAALARAERAEALVREVARSGVELDDERIDYVTVQIDRATWGDIARIAELEKP